ncbi:hypothetical protein HPB50_024978 [Hyalomma asiaticum]|uniref:Uncharacterized protein n=1 Tax=Hyalomma asiaticum TaxID=266040 RepID=A0ACB7TNN8_HYAAI|nr:hypothetical protein HPB50_024978 [Hyalomma asiaticum]
MGVYYSGRRFIRPMAGEPGQALGCLKKRHGSAGGTDGHRVSSPSGDAILNNGRCKNIHLVFDPLDWAAWNSDVAANEDDESRREKDLSGHHEAHVKGARWRKETDDASQPIAQQTSTQHGRPARDLSPADIATTWHAPFSCAKRNVSGRGCRAANQGPWYTTTASSGYSQARERQLSSAGQGWKKKKKKGDHSGSREPAAASTRAHSPRGTCLAPFRSIVQSRTAAGKSRSARRQQMHARLCQVERSPYTCAAGHTSSMVGGALSYPCGRDRGRAPWACSTKIERPYASRAWPRPEEKLLGRRLKH